MISDVKIIAAVAGMASYNIFLIFTFRPYKCSYNFTVCISKHFLSVLTTRALLIVPAGISIDS